MSDSENGADNSAEPLYDENLNGTQLIFHTVAEMQDFVQSVIETYGWIQEARPRSHIPNIKDNLLAMQKWSAEALTSLKVYRENGSKVAEFKDALMMLFGKYRFPLPEAPIAKWLSGQGEEDPDFALLCLASQLRIQDKYCQAIQCFHLTDPVHRRAAFATDSFIAGFNPGLAEAAGKGVDALIEKNTAKLGELDTLKRKTVAALDDFGNESLNALDHQEQQVAEFIKRGEAQIEAQEKIVERLQNEYREFITLQAPVEYWERKADGHKKSEESFLWAVILAIIVALGILSYLFQRVGYQAADLIKKTVPFSAYFLLAAQLLIAVTALFWAVRFIVKLFLSERHLRIDAQERAVMTKTYIALAGEGHASDVDRAIVLSTLFRPTTDGIVKEDGAGFNPADIMQHLPKVSTKG